MTKEDKILKDFEAQIKGMNLSERTRFLRELGFNVTPKKASVRRIRSRRCGRRIKATAE